MFPSDKSNVSAIYCTMAVTLLNAAQFPVFVGQSPVPTATLAVVRVRPDTSNVADASFHVPGDCTSCPYRVPFGAPVPALKHHNSIVAELTTTPCLKLDGSPWNRNPLCRCPPEFPTDCWFGVPIFPFDTTSWDWSPLVPV